MDHHHHHFLCLLINVSHLLFMKHKLNLVLLFFFDFQKNQVWHLPVEAGIRISVLIDLLPILNYNSHPLACMYPSTLMTIKRHNSEQKA